MAGEIHKNILAKNVVKKIAARTCDDVTLHDVTGSLKIESTRKQYSRTLKELAPLI